MISRHYHPTRRRIRQKDFLGIDFLENVGPREVSVAALLHVDASEDSCNISLGESVSRYRPRFVAVEHSAGHIRDGPA